MLISKTSLVTWNSKNKTYYTDLGYTFTKMKDTFEVDVKDLTKGSQAEVTVRCDYCGKEYTVKWYIYLTMRNKQSLVNRDCCKECLQIKSKDVVLAKYGGYSQMFEDSNKKRTETNIKKYGTANIFANNDIKQKIRETNVKKYGVPFTQQNPDIRQKTKSTCMKKYGVENYIEIYKGLFIKENSPVWKGGVKYSRVERATHEYNKWRKSVFSKDNYTCVKCGAHSGGQGSQVVLNAHHIKNWADNVDSRYDVENGITLCKDCHMKFHSLFGKKNNTSEELNLFLNS